MGLDVPPLIMGHEVAAAGDDVPGFAPGDRVAVAFYVTCGRCRYCRKLGTDELVDARRAPFSEQVRGLTGGKGGCGDGVRVQHRHAAAKLPKHPPGGAAGVRGYTPGRAAGPECAGGLTVESPPPSNFV